MGDNWLVTGPAGRKGVAGVASSESVNAVFWEVEATHHEFDVKIEELTIGARCSVKKKKSVHNLTAYVLRRGNSMDDSYGNPAFWTSVGQGKGTGKDLVQHRIQLKPPVVVAAGERLGMLLHCKEGKIAVTGRGPADVEVEGFKI
eukprot:gene26833-34917_t